MNKSILLAGVLSLAALSHAQDPDQQRVNAIWRSADKRIIQQIDVWFQNGDFPADISALSVQMELYPKDYDVATNLGWMQENIKQNDAALATYVRFAQMNPDDPDRSLPEADFYFRFKQYDKVVPLLEPAIQQAKHPHPNAYRILAHAYEKQKLYADAKRVYRLYLQVAPNDGAARVNLARVEKRLSSGS